MQSNFYRLSVSGAQINPRPCSHEIDHFWRHFSAAAKKISFIFTILIVNNYYNFSLTNIFDSLFNGVELYVVL
jgi:hypothetical protein